MGCGESKVKSSSTTDASRQPQGPVWSCEVEPGRWVPYEDLHQLTLEEAYAANRKGSCVLQVRVRAPPRAAAAAANKHGGRGAKKKTAAATQPAAPADPDDYRVYEVRFDSMTQVRGNKRSLFPKKRKVRRAFPDEDREPFAAERGHAGPAGGRRRQAAPVREYNRRY
eukprot:CAMPEP_0174852728 /NCGR_PEP_ID=MMETSP1114-20130205/26545_1 /TAXON_ID=312471 /ORGANISM="Neobodo designis, Strain CCAP 1951/1" /LENGTH=167 /DNA_ID=CAMNT_0016087339 /DNA_START=34 /DNA_END=537 /DNA_ORIENTATION=+